MENASKALIIAGAILLAILIIGLGMFIFNSASDTLNKTGARMTQEEKQTYNAQFQKFIGEKKSGTDVKTLVNVLVQNHSTQIESGEKGRLPAINYKSRSTTITATFGEEAPENTFNNMLNNIKITATYKVEVNLDEKAGLVKEINITDTDSL